MSTVQKLRSCGRMPSLVGDSGQVLGVQAGLNQNAQFTVGAAML